MKRDVISPQNVALILVTYKNIDDTVRCLESIYALYNIPGWILVIENQFEKNGHDPENLFSRWCAVANIQNYDVPHVYKDGASINHRFVFISLPDNKGFAAACNKGMSLLLANKLCSAFWILNNDTEVQPDTLESLCAALNGRPDAGAAASLCVDMGDRETLLCAGGGTFSRLSGITRDICAGWKVTELTKRHIEYIEKRIDYLCGASLLVPKESILSAGYMDEKYFLYYEDVDFSFAVKKAGYTLAVASNSIIFHKMGASTSTTGLVDFYSVRNRLYCVLKYYPKCIVFSIIYVIFGFLKSLLFLKQNSFLYVYAVYAFFSMKMFQYK